MRSHLAVVLTVMFGTLPHPSFASSANAGDRPAASSCERSLTAAFVRQVAGALPQACWRVGPIRLGMTEEEVERRLGAPMARSSRAASMATLYAFPFLGGPLVVNGRARLRMAELRFVDERLVAIDNDPPSSATSGACSPGHVRDPLEGVDLGANAGPLIRIAGIKTGDPLSQLRRRFGRAPAHNRPRDWYNYLPIPLSFTVDRHRISGFEVARDEAALTSTEPEPRIYVHREPATCRLTGIDFAFSS